MSSVAQVWSIERPQSVACRLQREVNVRKTLARPRNCPKNASIPHAGTHYSRPASPIHASAKASNELRWGLGLIETPRNSHKKPYTVLLYNLQFHQPFRNLGDNSNELYSKLLVAPFITATVVPYITSLRSLDYG